MIEGMKFSRPQLDGLTAVRGIAAWFVVLYHIRASTPWLPDGVMALAHKGYLAVDFFFLLSGFVIWLSAREDFAARGLAATGAFLRRRMARIYPLYAVMLALTILFAALVHTTGRDMDNYPWAELPLHILMLQNWGFTDALSWNHPAWSISTEFAAYLLFPLIALAPLCRAPRLALLIGIALLIGGMAAALHGMGFHTLGQNIPHTGLIRCLAEFTAGCLLCALWQKGVDAQARLALIGTTLVAVGGWLINPANELWAFPLIATSAIYLIADFSRSGRTIWRPLVFLGEISYATYLSHFMLFIWFKIAFVKDAANIQPHLIALFLALTFLASVLLYQWVEVPGRRLARSATQKARDKALVRA